ncbi:MraY family glycosyltransferase [Rhodanobacter sp. T12-5]|uniref:MraY family glycosyltransferase n=1 Tax=Rhodanobacter sp. T12-5 TaxID=2024611 RepID=UPI001A8C00BB|nr:MraY family glycosyltransferase [Rhodanobacter sp. T12-5]
MTPYRFLLAFASAAASSAIAIAFLYGYAEHLGLVDRPNERKKHVGNIPVIGGVCVFLGVITGAFVAGQFHLFGNYVLVTAAVLALIGALDDRMDLSVRARLLVQSVAVLTVIVCTGVHIHTLGHLFGVEMELGLLGIPLTLIAVIGLLNAFNMMDGIDGLAGMLALVSVGTIAVYQGSSPWPDLSLPLLLAAALLPYLAVNLGLIGKKIFLGDAGSMVVGYLLAWTLIKLSQDAPTHLSTIDVLWCVALPVLDTLAVMIRRIREGKSPFKPDRGHIHHLMLNAGLTPRASLVVLVTFAIALAYLGTFTRTFTAGSNLLAFGALALIYIAAHRRVWLKQQLGQGVPGVVPGVVPVPMSASAPFIFIERRTARSSSQMAHAYQRRRSDLQRVA